MPDRPPTVDDVDPTEARRLVGEGGLLLDVREADEWAAGRAPEARHLPMGEVLSRLDELPDGTTVVCICRVGGRSATVAAALAERGWDVRNVAGGMQAWEQSGLPVVADGGAVGRVV